VTEATVRLHERDLVWHREVLLAAESPFDGGRQSFGLGVFPRLLVFDELGHHLTGEQLERTAVRVVIHVTGLVHEQHLVDACRL
jgi:hypothetical protein